MEILFRRGYWLLDLLFLAALALLIAQITNTYFESLFTSGSALEGQPMTSGPPPPGRERRLSPEGIARLAGIALPSVQPGGAGPCTNAGNDDPNAPPRRTLLPLRLLGTTVANHPEWSWAVIEDIQSRHNGTFMQGDSLRNVTVLAILDDCPFTSPGPSPRGCVVILNDRRREFIDDRADLQTLTGVEVADASSPSSGIRERSKGEYEITRAAVDQGLNSIDTLAMQARVVPAFKDGAMRGFRFASIQGGSLYESLGFKAGDVVQRINGFEINSAASALEVYGRLKDAGRLIVEGDRNGTALRLTYVIR